MFNSKVFYLSILFIALPSCYLRKAYQFRKMERNDIYKMASTLFAPAESPFQFIEGNRGKETLKTTLDQQIP